MSDFHSMIERELTLQLCPVRAPAALWDSITARGPGAPGLRARRNTMGWLFVPAVAAVLVATSLGPILRFGHARDPLIPEIEQLTSKEVSALADGSERVDFRSGDPARIRAWVRANADLDVNLPATKSNIVGVRLARLAGAPVAVVAYRVGNDMAALVVSKEGSMPVRAAPHATTPGHGRLFTWNAGNQLFAVALSGLQDPRGACLLCHAPGAF